MYDNINFKSRCALTTFECSECVRLFSLVEIQKIQPNGTTVTEWQSDASKKMLPQYAGIGIKIKHDKTNVLRLQIEMSLHKYWNQRCNGLHLHNYNRFTMTDAKQAYQTLRNEFLTIGIDIQDFTVMNYELSVNLELDAHTTPEMIMCAAQSSAGKEIIQARNYDIHKLYGTHCTKEFRKVTVFYDKAHEVKQKNKKHKINGNTAVPQHLLRCELKYQNKDMRHNKTDLSV